MILCFMLQWIDYHIALKMPFFYGFLTAKTVCWRIYYENFYKAFTNNPELIGEAK